MELIAKFPQFQFCKSTTFKWSPADRTIHYHQPALSQPQGILSLLHEISHGLLGHDYFNWDIELLRFETEAWEKTQELSASHQIEFSTDQMEDALDSYRYWLYARSKCPNCDNIGVQQSPIDYRCITCHRGWKVSSSQICEVRRRETTKNPA